MQGHAVALLSFSIIHIIEIGTNEKPICDFLLVFHSNCLPSFYRFRVTRYNDLLIENLGYVFSPFLPTPVSSEALARVWDLGYESWHRKN